MAARSQVRLYAILARNAPCGVVFRRGPSKQVLLIRWDTSNDTFEAGQWFKGRIYERRCDLSPDGDLLLYFAANWQKPYMSWSAISRPPYLTALALWPKGDGWGGGGHFISKNQIALNHRAGETNLADGFSIPRSLRVKQFGDRPGWGEDDPIWPERLKRDGWKLTSVPARIKDDFSAKVWWEFDPPIQWEKPHPKWPKRYVLQMSIWGVHERDGPWYLIDHSVRRDGDEVDKIVRSEWAGWSPEGDLLFAIGGCLYRARCVAGELAPLEQASTIADFTSLKFEPRAAPENMRRWPRR